MNIPYFVSNGYIVFDPNIYYKDGEPGASAYNSVVSAAKYLAKMPWVDSTRMAIQGQSWGGYQVAYLVTRTNMFRAAWAGAPVANMTSAYGGIRWGSGLNRQFQYEHTQSRIGATLWQRQDLYLKNSPLFAADKVTTPLVMMGNLDLLYVRVNIDENDAWRFKPQTPAAASMRGNRDLKTTLSFVRVEPYVTPKQSLTGASTERVDTRVLQVLYSFRRSALPAYVGQQMDVFIETPEVPVAAPAPGGDKK